MSTEGNKSHKQIIAHKSLQSAQIKSRSQSLGGFKIHKLAV